MAAQLRLRLFSTLKFKKPIYAVKVQDTDGDGKAEIVLGSDEGLIHIYKYEKGSFEEVWQSSRWVHWVDQILIADIDDDAINEIFFVTGRHLLVFKYREPIYQLVWDYLADSAITSICVADSNNDHHKELHLGTNEGLLLVFAVKNEETLQFKQVWKRKLEGDVFISVGDIDGNTLNEIVVANKNLARVFRVVDKYPKKESWLEEFQNYIKRIHVFDWNSDNKEEIFFAMEDGLLRIFSHKDGDYISEDETISFGNIISDLESALVQKRPVLVVGSYDQTVRAFKADGQLFQIETDAKIYSVAVGDIDHDGKPELICSSGTNLYIFKEDVVLTIQMDYPNSVLADHDIQINYYITNTSAIPVTNIDFSNVDWLPDILTLHGSKPTIPLIEGNSAVEVNLKFTPSEVTRVTPIKFPRFLISFSMNGRTLSQLIPEITITLLPKFTFLAKNILDRCERLKNTNVPLKSLSHILDRDIGSLDYEIDELISRLLDMKLIDGYLEGRTLYIRDVRPLTQQLIIDPKKKHEPSFTPPSPELLLTSLIKAIERRKRSSISDLASQFHLNPNEVESTLIKLKDHFQITGFLISGEVFIALTPEEVDSIVTQVKESPYIPLLELAERYELSEREVEHFLTELIKSGTLHGEIREKDGIKRFITIKSLAETLYSLLNKNGKLAVLSYARKTNLSASIIREAIRALADSGMIQGHYTYNGAIFYTVDELENQLIEFTKSMETNSIGLTSISEQFQMSKDTITSTLGGLVSKKRINGYISENTFFKKSYEEEKLRDIFEKYVDAMNIIHILIIHRESGIALYSESYTPETIDASLVSGFLQAITSFGSEISGMEHAGLRLLEYKEFKISIRDGIFTRTALILKSEPSQRILEILKHFVKFFDMKHQRELREFKGFIDPFLETGNLIDEYFEISLSFPHEIQEKEVFKNHERLNPQEFVVINIIRGLPRQFQLSKLLEKASKELLLSQLEAFSIIYNLKIKKVIQLALEEPRNP